MAKDPAFLFYPGDASDDTQFMNRLERGAYFDLVKVHRKFHGYTVEQLRKILGKDYEEVWPALSIVMEKDENELFFIPWMREALRKREDYSQKQRDRINKRWKYHGNTTVLPQKEDENEIGIEDTDSKEKEEFRKPTQSRFKAPDLMEVEQFMDEANVKAGRVWHDGKVRAEAKNFWNYYEANGWRVGKNPMKKWDAAARNWMNNANKFEQTNTKNGRNTKNPPSDLAAQVVADVYGRAKTST